MHIRSGRPAKPKQPDRQPQTPHHRRIQPMFRDHQSLPALCQTPQILFPVQDSIEHRSRAGGQNAADPNRHEGEARIPSVEAVDALEDDGEGVEEGKEDGEVEADVEAEVADDGLGEDHMNGPEQGNSEQKLNGREAGGAGSGWWWEAKSSSALLEDDFLIGFLLGEGEEVGEDSCKYYWPLGGILSNGQLIKESAVLSYLRPSPSLVLRRKATDHRPQCRSQERRQHEQRDCNRTMSRRPDFRIRSGSDRQTGRAQESGEEATNEQRGKTLRAGGAQSEQRSDGEGG